MYKINKISTCNLGGIICFNLAQNIFLHTAILIVYFLVHLKISPLF